MTDTSFPVRAITGHDFGLSALQQNGLATGHQRLQLAAQEVSPEDDGQISCICGYPDDDGWTVQCDQCNRWQHQLCYYPQYEDRSLPDDLQHYCVECQPRIFDIESARVRQRLRREDAASEANGVKRGASKSHKKKVKEPPAYTNGWPLDKSRHDGNSASPRDQPPPAKRPKTSHRPSDSVASTKGHSRKRAVSNANHRRSLSRSPDTPYDLYSDHFMRCYLEDDWVVSDSNLHTSTDVRNALSDWLSASDDEFRVALDCEKREVLWRWDRELDAIPNKAQIEIREAHDDRVKDNVGNHPTWKWVTVQESIAEGAYIGELKGYVGFRGEYIDDAANRWQHLRHPEPFVFFHPTLPIYIDARNEGTQLRYVRRSCAPNARLSVLVTDGTDYHFCFMATQQIDPGMEIAVAWDTWDSVPALQQKQSSASVPDLDRLSSWVSKVLANCGPCACQLPGDKCTMARFDRRGSEVGNDHEPPPKTSKSRKKKGPGNHMSPLNTNLNSRSGSEARRVDLDDERSDSRSPSASAGRGSASRDITPNTHYSHAGSMAMIPEMSERERKKLAKEEEMFKKQAVEQSGRQGKKKRNSGGSSLSTPSATTSKQLGFGPSSSKYADAGTSRQTGLPPLKGGKRSKSNAQKSPGASVLRSIKRPKPDYVDASVQCDLESELEARDAPPPPTNQSFIPTTNRLLQRCALNNARRKGAAALAEAKKLTETAEKIEVEQPSSPNAPVNSVSPNIETVVEQPEAKPEASNDTEMKDVCAQDGGPVPPLISTNSASNDKSPPPVSAATATSPNDMEWSSNPPAVPSETTASIGVPTHHNPAGLHVQMPPPPLNPFAGALAPSPVSSTGTPGSALTQSPLGFSGAASLFSPAVNAAVGPSPAKKKLSLSDYTRRNKAKDHREIGEMKSERESSPASVTSATTATPFLPTVAEAEPGKPATETSSVPEEERDDVKMEDAPDAVTPAVAGVSSV